MLNCPDTGFLAARWAGKSSESELPVKQEACSYNKTFQTPRSGADVFHGSKNTTERGQQWCFPLRGLGLGHSRGSFWQEMKADTEVYPFLVTQGIGSSKCWPCPRQGFPTQSTQDTPAQALHPSVYPSFATSPTCPFPTGVGRQEVPAGLLLWAKQSGVGQFHLMNCQLIIFTDLGSEK